MYVPEIDTDIPFHTLEPEYADLRERVAAAFASLESLGADVLVTEEDAEHARAALTTGIDDAELASPGAVVHLHALLSKYDQQVVRSAVQIRNYVINRLLEDSDNPDPRIRVRCYEMLGKVSDVGLFTEKSEVTHRTRPTEELEQLLRERLMKTIDAAAGTIIEPPLTFSNTNG